MLQAMSPAGELDILPESGDVDSPTSYDDNHDGDSTSKLDLNAQTNGLSPKGPSGTISSVARSSGLVFINYTTDNESQAHNTTNPPTRSVDSADNHTPHQQRSHSPQTSAHNSPHQRPRSRSSSTRDLSGSTLGSAREHCPLASARSTTSSIDSAFSTLRAGTHTANGSPFPVLTPADPAAPLPYTPRCPTCGSSSTRRSYAYDPLNTSTSSIPSSRLTPHRPAPPPPTSTTTTPSLASAGGPHHRHRANALAVTPAPPFRLQPPPVARRRAPPASRPPLFRTNTSPVAAAEPVAESLDVRAEAWRGGGRRRSQSDVRHDRSRSPLQQQGAGTAGTPPRTPRLRPRRAEERGCEGRGSGGEWDEFEGLVEALREAYGGEDRGGRRVIREVLEGMMEGKRRELGAGGISIVGGTG